MSSNFSEKALKESRARDKRAEYSEAGKKFGSTGINWQSMSKPVISGILPGNKVLIRQYGYGSEPILIRNGNPVYEKIGVQSVYNIDPETNALSPTDEIPQTIRFKSSSIPLSYQSDNADNWHKASERMENLMSDWANMINGITEKVPDISTMPLFEKDHVFSSGDSYEDDINEYDESHKDAGTIISDMRLKDVKGYHSNLQSQIKNMRTQSNIIAACSRKY